MSTGLQLRELVLHGTEDVRTRTFANGTVTAIIGPSGGERSRLLLTAAGLHRPLSGQVLLNGSAVTPKDAGTADENHSLVDGLSAAENVAARVLARRELVEDDWAAISALLASVGLPESSWHNLVEQLSGGQQQRVAVARALADHPALLCLDDPTSELDADSAALVWARIAEAAARGAVVLVGLPDHEGAKYADNVLEVEVD